MRVRTQDRHPDTRSVTSVTWSVTLSFPSGYMERDICYTERSLERDIRIDGGWNTLGLLTYLLEGSDLYDCHTCTTKQFPSKFVTAVSQNKNSANPCQAQLNLPLHESALKSALTRHGRAETKVFRMHFESP
jgi:hypothetical protein